ncbi:MAG: FG-GAP-like repeat-containing protein [Alphaproteobacteria bacterium]|nr:FG-GAP-like repeat-containing protein [Alphaproteobacteria bacterium]
MRNLKFISTLLILLIHCVLFSQNIAPKIYNYSSSQAFIGSVITINGQNFGSSIQNNAVFFGNVSAKIIQANPNQIQAIVPIGANLGPISVEAHGFVARGSAYFYPISPNGNPNQILSKDIFKREKSIQFNALSKTNFITSADLDLNNNSDLIIANPNQGILIYNNNPSFNNIFDNQNFIDIGTPNYLIPVLNVQKILPVDINGDGHLDLVTIYKDSAYFSVYQNTSSPYQYSFQLLSQVYLDSNYLISSRVATQNQLLDLTIADMNNDGKLDMIAIPQNVDSVSGFRIYLNNSSPGNFNVSSPLNFGQSGYHRFSNIFVIDIDNDTYQDVVAFDTVLKQVEVYRNISALTGFLNFAPPISITKAKNIDKFFLADFNVDSLADFVIGHPADSSFSVYLNASSSAPQLPSTNHISFTNAFQYNIGKVFNDFNISDINGDGLVDVLLYSHTDSSYEIFPNNTFPNTNDLQFTKGLVLKTKTNALKFHSTDLNNSNKIDLLYFDTNANGLGIFLDSSFLTFSALNSYNFKADSVYSIRFQNNVSTAIQAHNNYWLEVCDSFGNFDNPVFVDSLINYNSTQGVLNFKFPSFHYYTPQNLIRIRSTQPNVVSSFKNFSLEAKPQVFLANKVILSPGDILTLSGVGFNIKPNQLYVQFKNRLGDSFKIFPAYLDVNTIQILIPETLKNGVYSLQVYQDSIFKFINYNLIRIANNNHLRVLDPVPSNGSYQNYYAVNPNLNLNPVEIYSSSNKNVALMNDGTLSIWGINTSLNGLSNFYMPDNLKNVVDVSVSSCNTTALLWDGTMKSWGHFYNKYSNTFQIINANVLDSNNKNIFAVFSNSSEIIAIDNNQKLVGFSPYFNINSELSLLNQNRFIDLKLGENYNVFLSNNQRDIYFTNTLDSTFVTKTFNYPYLVNKIVYGEDDLNNNGLAYDNKMKPIFKPFSIYQNQAQFIDTNLFQYLHVEQAQDFSIGNGIFSILNDDSTISETVYNSSRTLPNPFPNTLKNVTNFVSGQNYTLALYNPYELLVSLNDLNLGLVDSIYYLGFNDSTTIIVTPKSGYKVDSVLINGTQKLPIVYDYTTNNTLNYLVKDLNSNASFLFILKPIGNISKISSYKSNSFFGSTFSGAGGSNAFIALPKLDLSYSDYTVEMWFKGNGAFLNFERLFDFGTNFNSPNSQGALLAFKVPGSGFLLHNNSADINIQSPANFNYNAWNHYAFVMSNNRLLLYLNGVKILDTPQPYATSAFVSNFVGKSNWTADPATNGNFEDVRIWKAARSAQEILAYFNGNLLGNEPGLLYWLPLNNHHKYIQNIPIVNNTAVPNAAITNIALTDSAFLNGSKPNIITTVVPNLNLVSKTNLNFNNLNLLGFGKMYSTNQYYTYSSKDIYTSQPATAGNFTSVYSVNNNLFNSTFNIDGAKQLNSNGDLLVLGLDFNNQIRLAKVPPASPGNIGQVKGGSNSFTLQSSLNLYGLNVEEFAYNINGSNNQIAISLTVEPVLSFNNSNQYVFIGNLDTVNYTIGTLSAFYCGFKIYALEFVNNVVYILDRAGNLYKYVPATSEFKILAKNLTNGIQVNELFVNPLNNDQLYITTAYSASPIIYSISQNNYYVVNGPSLFFDQGAVGIAPTLNAGEYDIFSEDTAQGSTDYFINRFNINPGQTQTSTSSISAGIYYNYDPMPRILGQIADSVALNINTILSLSLDSGQSFYRVTMDRSNRFWSFNVASSTKFKYGNVILKKLDTISLISQIIDQFKVIIVPDTPRNLKLRTENNLIKLYCDTPSYAGGAQITQYAVYNNRNSDVTYSTSIPITPYIRDQQQTYRFYVTAINAAGESFASQWSDSIYANEVFKISTAINYGGSISDSSFQLIRSQYRITYNLLPNFKIDSIVINGINRGNDSVNGYTFRNISGDSSIQVFVTDTHSINYIEELYKIGRDVNFTNRGIYYLRRDLDFNDPQSYLAGVVNSNFTSNQGFPPIRFYGSFYGNNFHIKNLYINLPKKDTVGLFNLFGYNQIFTGLILDNPWVLGRYKVGSLLGFINCGSFNNNLDPNNALTNKISQNGVIGGLIRGYDVVGGLIGENYGGIIYNCFAKTTVEGSNWEGGFIGRNDNKGLIFNSFAGSKILDIDTTTNTSGGFLGVNSDSSVVHDSYAVSNLIKLLIKIVMPSTWFPLYDAGFGCINERGSLIYNCFSANQDNPFLGFQDYLSNNFSNIGKASVLINEDSFTQHPTQFIFNPGKNYPRVKDIITQDTLFFQYINPTLILKDSSKNITSSMPQKSFGETITVSKINNNQLIDSLFINNNLTKTDSKISYTSYGLTLSDSFLFVFGPADNYVKIDTQIIGNGKFLVNKVNFDYYYLKGDTIRILFEPNKGFHVDSVWVNNSYVDSLNGFTFSAINQNQSISAKFVIDKDTLFTKSIGNGSIDTTQVYNYGSKVVIRFYPQKGYAVDSIRLQSAYRRFQDSLVIDSLLNNDSLFVRFNFAKYMVSVVVVGNGMINPNKDSAVRIIDSIGYKFIANTGYYIDSVFVNDSLLQVLDTVLLTQIYQNTVLKVSFKPIPAQKKRITIRYSSGGVVLAKYGISYVDSNSKFILNNVPNVGFRVDSLLVNNKLVDSTTSYTIDSVKTDYDFEVLFGNFDYRIITKILNGTISTTQYLKAGDSVRITYTPASNFIIDSIFINGLLVNDSISGYTFKNVTSDQLVSIICQPLSIAPRTLNLRLFIEGYYNGNNAMRSVLANAFSLGCTTCSNDSNYSDSIIVALIDNNNVSRFERKIALDTNGYGSVLLDNNLTIDAYYLQISGRNFVTTYSANRLSTNFRIIKYDFTSGANQAFGSNLVRLENGFWSLYSGLLINTNIEITLDDIIITKIGINNYLNGYVPADVNGDGIVTNDDVIIMNRNFKKIIQIISPFN